MAKTHEWTTFFQDRTLKAFTHAESEGKYVLDIGGGLRIDKTKNNRFNPENYAAFHEASLKVDYKIMDPVPDYAPDLIGDIHHLPLANESVDALFCIAVLEHVEDPIRAVAECKRVLKVGASAIFYVPFLYYYHAEVGYYGDYWRFTSDTCDYLFKDMKVYEKMAVRGRFGTLGRLSGKKFLEHIGNILDGIFKKKSKQVSGYYIHIQK